MTRELSRKIDEHKRLPDAIKELRDKLWDTKPCGISAHKFEKVEGCTICTKCGWVL